MLRRGCVLPHFRHKGHMHMCTHTHTDMHAGAPPALPFLAGGAGRHRGQALPVSQLSGYRVQQQSSVHPKPLFHKAQQHGKRGVHVCVVLGGGYFGNSRLNCC